MKQDIILKSGWLKVDKGELTRLRLKMREIYEAEGGNKKFNAHLPNYEDLRDIIRDKLNELEKVQNIEFKIHELSDYEIIPGTTFFRNLLYINKDARKSPIPGI